MAHHAYVLPPACPEIRDHRGRVHPGQFHRRQGCRGQRHLCTHFLSRQRPGRLQDQMNRAKLKTLMSGMICAFGFCAASFAHHSFAVYDNTKTSTLKGTVKAFQWTNPHSVIWIMVQPNGGGAPEEW